MPSLADIPTPRVVVDRARLTANIAAMQSLAASAGVRLRPHAKTHKSPIVARMQIAAGAVGICCAKLGEAEVFAEAGIADIRVPYPVQSSNADRVLALMARTRLSIIVDDLEVATAWSEAMVAAGRELDVLVKIDVGFHRCGVNPDAPKAVETIRAIAALRSLRFQGLLSHAGQGYGAGSAEELEAVAEREARILGRIASELRGAGRPVAEVSVGATPTARFIGRQQGVTEMRPGNYVFFDRTQIGLGAARLDDCALSVVATVVSRPTPTRAVLDTGSKSLSSDIGGLEGYGLVAGTDLTLTFLNEEHGVIEQPEPFDTLRIGQRVRVIPNHVCVVSNLFDEVHLISDEQVIETVPVAARGRVD